MLRTCVAHTYDELKQALIEEFGRVFTMNDVFQQLKSRTLKPNESVKRYVLEMQEIASRAAIPKADVIDCIIDGIHDTSNNAAMLSTAHNLKELKSMLERYEKSRTRVPAKPYTTALPNRVAAATTTAVAAAAQSKPRMPVTANIAGHATAGTEVRCFNCSGFEHNQSQCPKPPNACFRCNEVGHFHSNYPKMPRVVAVTGDEPPESNNWH